MQDVYKYNSCDQSDEQSEQHEEQSLQNARNNLPLFSVRFQNGCFFVILKFFKQIVSHILR